MYPILFNFGFITIYTYGFFIGLGFITGIFLARREAVHCNENPEKVTDLIFYGMIAGIVGSRLFYAFTKPAVFLNDPVEIFRLWNGGLVFYGGFIPAMITVLLFIKKNRLPMWKIADIIAPSLAIGHALGRIGCFFSGCCYGKSCTLPWAITFTRTDSLAPLNEALHPTQLYSSLNSLSIFVVLIMLRKFKKFNGQLFWIYVMLYGVTRSIIELFRNDYRGDFLFELFSVSQVIGATMTIIAAVMLIYLGKQKSKSI